MKFTFTIVFCIISTLVFSQVVINNGSFEDERNMGVMPHDWFACNRGSTPDILPGFWNVELIPSNGESYIGLISREDGTTESIGQKLSIPYISGECYKSSVDLAHSDTYSHYNLPLELKIWGSIDGVTKNQLFYRSSSITRNKWVKYFFSFTANDNYKYIIIEAVKVKGIFFNYKGNILIDNIAPMIKCDRA